ncbi:MULTISPECIES: hypothetical protein [Thermus]|uniref:hypothetical protein n=1 Tax=Thermus TaxID=270 RepID=UPI001F2304CE|nr:MULTISPECIES: hypothetical protein [Thermus]
MNAEAEVTFLDLLKALRRSWYWLLGGGLLLGVLVGWGSVLLPPRYVSEMAVQVATKKPQEGVSFLVEPMPLATEGVSLALPRPSQLPWGDWIGDTLTEVLSENQTKGKFDAVYRSGVLSLRGFGSTPEEAQREAHEVYEVIEGELRKRVEAFWRSYLRGEEMVLRQGLGELREALQALAQKNPDSSIPQHFQATATLMEVRIRQLEAYQEETALHGLVEETLASSLSLLQAAQIPEHPQERYPWRYGVLATLTFWLFGSLLVFTRELLRA